MSKPLVNPINDASDIAEKLESVGFDVILRINSDLKSMRRAINKFGNNLKKGDSGFFFFAGHAVQYQGRNYLIPVNSINNVTSPNHLNDFTVSLDSVLVGINPNNDRLNVVMVDACRNSPFTSLPKIGSGLSRGLTRINNKVIGNKFSQSMSKGLEGTLIAYSTAPGHVALDGVGRNSPYTKVLLKHITKPNFTIEAILKSTRAGVKRATRGKQTPWYESSINGDYFPAGQGRISFVDLLGLFLIDEHSPGNVGSWSYGSQLGTPISWAHSGIARSGTRNGKVIITVDGKPSHHILLETRTPVKWSVALEGPRGFINTVLITNNIYSPENNKGLIPKSQKHLFTNVRRCDQDGRASEGKRIMEINIPNKKLAWLTEEWSCGSAGCNYWYQLFYNKSKGQKCP